MFSENQDPFPIMKEFTVIDNLGNCIFGGDVFDAGTYYVPENFLTGKQIDIYFLSVYDAMFVSTSKGELVNWQESLNNIASSMEFTDIFMNEVQSQLDA